MLRHCQGIRQRRGSRNRQRIPQMRGVLHMKREDPPAQTRGSRSGSNHYADESAEARENPGTWFLLKTYDKATDKDKASGYGLATNIRAGKIAAFRPGGAFDSRG